MRLIDADVLRKFLHEDDFDTPDERWKPESEFAKMIDALPTVDIKTEVAREIFAEIEGKLRHTKVAYREEVFNELKNKYTEVNK